MTTENLALFKAMGAKMDFLNQRQRVLAQNISNADTPNYKPRDIQNADFSRVLDGIKSQGQAVPNVRVETTDDLHLPPPNEVNTGQNRKSKYTYEIAPAGNSVIMEEQVMKSGQTVMDYNLMTNLYQKNIGMIRMAISNR